MRQKLLNYVTNNWKKFGLSHKPDGVDFFIKNKYRKLTFFFFERGNKKPFALAKLTTFPLNKNEIVDENRILRYVNSRIEDGLRGTIPQPIALRHLKGHPVLFESFLTGKPMGNVLNGFFKVRKFDYYIKKINDWLISFNGSFKDKPVYLDGKNLQDLLIEPIYKSIKIDSTLSKKQFQWLIDDIKLLRKEPLYLIPKHTDFWLGNILIDNGTIKVLDWEDFGMSKLPLFDLFHFIVSYFLVTKFRFIGDDDIFSKIFFDDNKYTQSIKNNVIRYCQAFDIDTRFLDIFFALYLVELYNLRYEQEGPNYEVTARSNRFIKIFLKNRANFILNDVR